MARAQAIADAQAAAMEAPAASDQPIHHIQHSERKLDLERCQSRH